MKLLIKDSELYSMEQTAIILGINEEVIQKFIEDGRLEVNGNFVNGHSMIALLNRTSPGYVFNDYVVEISDDRRLDYLVATRNKHF